MKQATAADVVADIPPLQLEDGELVEGCVLLVKTSTEGESALRRDVSTGISHWEAIGMLVEAADGMCSSGRWINGG